MYTIRTTRKFRRSVQPTPADTIYMAMPGIDWTHDNEPDRDRAQAWVAQFAPLLLDDETLDEAEIRRRLDLIGRLKENAAEVSEGLVALQHVDDHDLVQTFHRAHGQLDSLDVDLRKRLGRLRPGDPQSIADLDALQERLDERAARQEMGLPTDQEIPQILEMRTAPGNPAGAAFLGIFGLGWNAFTTFHAVLMIGGMTKAFGWGALALLGFYAIFFFAGFAMLYGALNMASSENITLHGRNLKVTRKLGPWTRRKSYTLAAEGKASIGETDGLRGNNQPPIKAVLLLDDADRPVALASNATPAVKERVRDRINAYLEARPT